jgi:serine/threonine protein phosphatase PrpC
MQGWRMSMEDAHLASLDLSEGISLFCVFDGHGGPEVAKFCAEYFGKYLLENESYQKGEYKKALEENFLKMDELLMDEKGVEMLRPFKTEKDIANSFAGCTANVVLFTKDKYYIANAGDARSVLFTKKDEVLALSTDHKPEDERELKRIEKAGGYVSDGRVNDNLNLTRAIGDLEYKKNKTLKPEEQIISGFPDVEIRDYTPDDNFILIGCDGIWETKSTKDICEFARDQINEKVELSKIVESILDMVIAKETIEGFGCDNMSLIMVKFKN